MYVFTAFLIHLQLEERYPKYVVSKDDNGSTTMEEDEDDDDAKSATFALSRATLIDDEGGLRRRRDSRDETSKHHKSKSRNTSRSTSPHRPSSSTHGITKPTPNRHRQQPLVRSKWHQIVMHASSAAGTTAAVVSEESMKCLKYCLNWLQVCVCFDHDKKQTPTKFFSLLVCFTTY